MTTSVHAGLEGVVAAETRLSGVDGQRGELIIAGFPVEELAGRSTFEETLWLLWHDALPTAAELAALHTALSSQRQLPESTVALLRAAAVQRLGAMDALELATASLRLTLPAGQSAEDSAVGVVARLPVLIAAYWRLTQGAAPLASDPALGHAANFLWLLTGERPSAERVRGLETYLNTVVDHGLNASTFAARVIIATQSDVLSALVGALGALKGPLHGGAPGPALDMVFEIGDEARIRPFLTAKLDRGERLMGFGHRVYKVRDPRAEVLAAAAAQLYQADGDLRLYRLATAVEREAVALLAERKPGRNLQTNVEFYTALLLHGLGLTTELFTPVFAMSRVVGWAAHCFEQQAANRLIRPQSVYTGVKDRQWLPVAARG